MSGTGWRLSGAINREYTMEEILNPVNRDKYYGLTFYKERWFKIHGEDPLTNSKTELEQRCIVSFSLKYMEYQCQRRSQNIEKAERAISHGNAADPPKNFRSYIVTDRCTQDGKLAPINAGFHIDQDKIALPQNRQGNQSAFSTCFVALFIYRVLEHRLSSEYTTDQILDTLKDMNALHTPSEGFIPTFKRTELTDKLFEISGFRLDTEIIMFKRLKSIIAQTKN